MEDFVAQLVAAHHEVMSALNFNLTTIVEAWEGPGVFDGIAAFVNAVDWSESFFVYLLTFHVIVLVSTLGFSWGSTNRTAAAMVMLLVMILCASPLNALGKEHFKDLFADQRTNYFDDNGVFVGAVFAAPLMLLAFFLQLKLFWNLMIMMIKVKKAKLRHEGSSDNKGSANNRKERIASPKDTKKSK